MASQSFAADVSRFAAKTKLRGILVVKKICFDGYGMLLRRSPVDTGRFRGSWRIAVNHVDLSTLPEQGDKAKVRGPSGGKQGSPITGGEGAGAAASLAVLGWEDTVYITNNVPYAEELEKGSSQQAPAGVLRPTFEDIKANLGRNAGGGQP